MTDGEHETFCKFVKMNPPIFQGTNSEEAFEFSIDCHEHLHKIVIVEKYRVEFVFFQLQNEAKQQ